MKRLYDLDPAEVSLVPRGANRKKFLVFKSHKGSRMAKAANSDREIRALIDSVSPETMAKVDKILKSMTKKAAGDMEPRKDSATFKAEEHGGMEHEPEHQPLSERAQAALKAVARIMAPFKDELTDDHVGAVAHEVGIGGSKTEPADEKTPHDEEMHKDLGTEAIPEDVEDEHHAEALAMARKAYGEHLTKLGYRKSPDAEMQQKSEDSDMEDEDDEEEESVGKVSKSAGTLDLSAFPKEQRSQLESVFKAHNELAVANKEQVKKIADLQTELAHERDLRVTGEFTERAKGFKHLGADTAKLAKVLKTLAATDEDAFKEVESVLKAADRQIGTADLFGERGSKLARTGDPSSAEAKLDSLVDQVVEKSGHELSKEQAYEKILKTAEGKRLYAEYKAGRPGGI